MATKRPAEGSADAPMPKRSALALGPIDIGPATGEDDLNVKVLQVQNRKLSDRLRERNRKHEALEVRIQRLEQDKDDHAKLAVSIRRHLANLKNHLIALLAPLGASSLVDGLSEELLGDLTQNLTQGPQCLERAFEYVFSSLQRVGEEGMSQLSEKLRASQTLEPGKLQSMEEGHSQILALLGGLQTRQDATHLKKLQDEVGLYEAKMEQLENALADAKFDLQKAQSRCDQLEVQLADVVEELHSRPSLPSPSGSGGDKPGSSSAMEVKGDKASEQPPSTEELEQLASELEEQQAVAEGRLKEIEAMSKQLAEARKELERLKLDRQIISESDVRDSPVFKSLQTQYSIVCQENSQLRTCAEEGRRLLNTAKSQHFMQLEEIRQEELKYQLEVREERVQLETALASAKRDYELLRIEFEKNMASNDLAAPIAKELQLMVVSLQKTIQQLKGEVNRYKARAHKAEQQLVKDDKEPKDSKEKEKEKPSKPVASEVAKEGAESKEDSSREVEELQARVKTLTEEKQSLEIQLDGHRQAAKEERERGEIIAAEKKARAQVEDMKRRFEEFRRDYEKRKEHLKEEAGRKAKQVAEDNKHLQKELSAKKQEAQALVLDMECTAQAFEEMQEQNIRLLQQLKEKDDANYKLMSERIKGNSLQKLLVEEKDLLESQIGALNTEKARMVDMMTHLDERERNSDATLQSTDKELSLKQQVLELHKRKALDSVQALQEVQLRLSEVERQVQISQKALQDKTEEWEKENQLLKRSQEETASLKRRLEKLKNRELATTSDEILLEELKTYKAKLNCPCCSARKKDTVLTKCFHVFCSECIRNRYDSRLRKCPKCGAAFGANDFHKIYLS